MTQNLSGKKIIFSRKSPNQNFGQKSRFYSKFALLVKKRHVGQKSKFYTKSEIRWEINFIKKPPYIRPVGPVCKNCQEKKRIFAKIKIMTKNKNLVKYLTTWYLSPITEKFKFYRSRKKKMTNEVESEKIRKVR